MGVTIRIDDEVMSLIRLHQAAMIAESGRNVTVGAAVADMLSEEDGEEVSEDGDNEEQHDRDV